MSEFEKHFPKPVAKDNPHFYRQIHKWKARREGALWALKWVEAYIKSPCGNKYDIPLKYIGQEIAELENETP